MVLVGMTLTAVLWPFWLAVAAGIVLAAEMVLPAVMAPIVDVGVLPLNAEKNYEDAALVVVLSAELWWTLYALRSFMFTILLSFLPLFPPNLHVPFCKSTSSMVYGSIHWSSILCPFFVFWSTLRRRTASPF